MKWCLEISLLDWMSLTHCCFLGKFPLLISPLLFFTETAIRAIISATAEVRGKQGQCVCLWSSRHACRHVDTHPHGDVTLTAHVLEMSKSLVLCKQVISHLFKIQFRMNRIPRSLTLSTVSLSSYKTHNHFSPAHPAWGVYDFECFPH